MIKHKVLAFELRLEAIAFDLMFVINDSPMQLKDVLETMMFEVGTGLLTADPASAIEHYFFIFLSYELFFDE